MLSHYYQNKPKSKAYTGYQCHVAQNTDSRYVLPLPPETPEQRFEMECYVRFMRCLRTHPNSRMTIKILSAIRSAADFMKAEEDHVAKVLIDLGLRAPQAAFPSSFLRHCAASIGRTGEGGFPPPPSIRALYAHWKKSGETLGKRNDKDFGERERFYETTMA